MELRQALDRRKSVRGYLQKEIDRPVLERIFANAQRAPSWCNIQPWRVWVVSGAMRTRVTTALTEAAKAGPPRPDFEWPASYPEPYATFRKECGRNLYGAMGVRRDDAAARHEAWMRNYVAFDAPHVCFVAVERSMGPYPILDVGCWLSTLMYCAIEEGVSTCAQASLATHPHVVRPLLEIPDNLGILCGIAMGYEDEAVAANACVTDRSSIFDNVFFVDG